MSIDPGQEKNNVSGNAIRGLLATLREISRDLRKEIEEQEEGVPWEEVQERREVGAGSHGLPLSHSASENSDLQVLRPVQAEG